MSLLNIDVCHQRHGGHLENTPEDEHQLTSFTAHFPRSNEMEETTNQFTHKRDPDIRTWKSPIMFQIGNGTTECLVDTLRIEKVGIPYSQDEGYGDDFVYLCLSDKLAKLLSAAGEKHYPIMVREKNLFGQEGEWWRVACKVNGLFGFIDGLFGFIEKEDMLFQTASVSEIMRKSGKGITATMNLRFFCQVSLDKSKKLDDDVARSLVVEVVRGYITSLDEDIKLPFRGTTVLPKLDKRDLTSPSIRRRLRELGT